MGAIGAWFCPAISGPVISLIPALEICVKWISFGPIVGDHHERKTPSPAFVMSAGAPLDVNGNMGWEGPVQSKMSNSVEDPLLPTCSSLRCPFPVEPGSS